MVTRFWFTSCLHGEKCPSVMGTMWRSNARKPARIFLSIIVFQAMPAENVWPPRSKSQLRQVTNAVARTELCYISLALLVLSLQATYTYIYSMHELKISWKISKIGPAMARATGLSNWPGLWKWKCLYCGLLLGTLLTKHLLSIDFENKIRTSYQNWRDPKPNFKGGHGALFSWKL